MTPQCRWSSLGTGKRLLVNRTRSFTYWSMKTMVDSIRRRTCWSRLRRCVFAPRWWNSIIKAHPKQHLAAYRQILPFLVSRASQLNQEFALFPTAPPHEKGGIFELRSYHLQPGTLLEWESTWFVNWLSSNACSNIGARRRGIEARRKFVAPVGAWFSQAGRLHQVHHLWQYP